MRIVDGPFAGLREFHYKAVVIDPPWDFAARSDKGEDRSAKKHYLTMKLPELQALPVPELLARDALVALWTTDTHLGHAFDLLAAWGLTYKTVGFYWTKDNRTVEGKFKGMGFWTRANPEQVLIAVDDDDNQALLATRGSPKRVMKNVPKLIEAPRREHSRKPDDIYERVEALVEGPYLDLFARESRPGWTTWGNQRHLFDRKNARDALL